MAEWLKDEKIKIQHKVNAFLGDLLVGTIMKDIYAIQLKFYIGYETPSIISVILHK